MLLLFVLVLGVACSPQKQLTRKYTGEGVEVLYKTFGEPHREESLAEGNKLLVFRKEEVVRPTPVGTGRYTADPMISPGFLKVEERHFVVNEKGVIISAHYKKEIEK